MVCHARRPVPINDASKRLATLIGAAIRHSNHPIPTLVALGLPTAELSWNWSTQENGGRAQPTCLLVSLPMREYPSVSPEWGTELTRVAVSRRHTCPQLVLLGHRQARASFATATATLAATAAAIAAAARRRHRLRRRRLRHYCRPRRRHPPHRRHLGYLELGLAPFTPAPHTSTG